MVTLIQVVIKNFFGTKRHENAKTLHHFFCIRMTLLEKDTSVGSLFQKPHSASSVRVLSNMKTFHKQAVNAYTQSP